MVLTLPNLDDRRWGDLVEEGRALIPVYAPTWTDHNVHDPGITLIELLAWIAEADLYQLNRVPAARRRKFLALIGIEPLPPLPARTVVGFRLKNAAESVVLPAETQLQAAVNGGRTILFQTVEALQVVAGELSAVQTGDAARLVDVTAPFLRRSEPLKPFGDDPRPGAVVCFGFAGTSEPGSLSLFFVPAGERADDRERERICDLDSEHREHCVSREPRPCSDVLVLPCDPAQPPPLRHPAVELVWEVHSVSGRWTRLPADRVVDDTRALTLAGRVVLDLSGFRLPAARLGAVSDELVYARCRYARGAYDAAPRIGHVVFNAVGVEQTRPAGVTTWEIAAPWCPAAPSAGIERPGRGESCCAKPPKVAGRLENVAVRLHRCGQVVTARDESARGVVCRLVRENGVPMAGVRVSAVGLTQPAATDDCGEATIDLPAGRREFRLRCECLGASIDVAIRNCPLDAETGLRVTLPVRVDVVFGESDVAVPVLAFQPAQNDRPALVTLPIVSLGVGTGRPGEVAKLPDEPVSGGRFELLTREPAGWRRWERRGDFLASRRVDAHFVLDPSGGSVQFGDGERGRVAPAGAPLIAIFTATDGAAGNLAAGTIATVPESLLNRLAIPDFPETVGRIASVRNGLPATGGSSGESLDEAAARAFRDVRRSDRAVTIADYEHLALETPGTHLARVKAWANRHPDFPCIANAVGAMTVIVVPFLPAERPEPSPATLHAVAMWLQTRRLLGSRVEVVGPTYVPLRVRARVRACSGSDPAALAARIRTALNTFLHPLRGGSDGRGWPFGRDVYRSEILQVIDETRGTDHVLFLEFLGADDRPRCGNVCVPEAGLVSAGIHEIEVLRGDP